MKNRARFHRVQARVTHKRRRKITSGCVRVCVCVCLDDHRSIFFAPRDWLGRADSRFYTQLYIGDSCAFCEVSFFILAGGEHADARRTCLSSAKYSWWIVITCRPRLFNHRWLRNISSKRNSRRSQPHLGSSPRARESKNAAVVFGLAGWPPRGHELRRVSFHYTRSRAGRASPSASYN